MLPSLTDGVFWRCQSSEDHRRISVSGFPGHIAGAYRQVPGAVTAAGRLDCLLYTADKSGEDEMWCAHKGFRFRLVFPQNALSGYFADASVLQELPQPPDEDCINRSRSLS